MFDRAGMKLGLDRAVLQSMNTSQGGKDAANSNNLSKGEVEMLLKKGAYGALMEDETAGDQFCEEDIEVRDALPLKLFVNKVKSSKS